jgi:copper transport protein
MSQEELHVKAFIAVATTVALLALSALADAHAHLKESQPAEGSIVAAAPSNLVLKFSEDAQLTALTVQQEGGAEQKIAPLPTAPSVQVSVPMPRLSPGKYIVSWRVVSHDNHVMAGRLRFTIGAVASSSDAKK